MGNAVSLGVIALVTFYEAVRWLGHPEAVESAPMIVVALAAVLLNGLIRLWLCHGAQHDLNVRSAYLHMLGGALFALGGGGDRCRGRGDRVGAC
jgi:cobalt-zinc-cadmium efflux system protein